MDISKISEYFKTVFDKYKYVLIICLVGLALTCFPSSSEPEKEASPAGMDDGGIEKLEGRIEAILGQMAGVGRVEVVLTAKSSSQSVYAYNEDKNMSRSENGQTADSRSSLASLGSSGSQQPVMLRIDEPEYRGAFIVCDGADTAKVRLEITQAVASLTGISTDNIVISKMK